MRNKLKDTLLLQFMGRPLTKSVDMYITYPLVEKIAERCENVSPMSITVLCIVMKILSIYSIYENEIVKLCIYLIMERILDCLDGEVARLYNKCSVLGHYVDKYSDLLYRIAMIYSILEYIIYRVNVNIYTYILLYLTILLPSTYILDSITGNLDYKLICKKTGYAIIVEDNATIICILLPYLLYYSNNTPPS